MAGTRSSIVQWKTTTDVGGEHGCHCAGAQTALHYACEKGHAAVVRELPDRGADTEAKDNVWMTV